MYGICGSERVVTGMADEATGRLAGALAGRRDGRRPSSSSRRVRTSSRPASHAATDIYQHRATRHDIDKYRTINTLSFARKVVV